MISLVLNLMVTFLLCTSVLYQLYPSEKVEKVSCEVIDLFNQGGPEGLEDLMN